MPGVLVLLLAGALLGSPCKMHGQLGGGGYGAPRSGTPSGVSEKDGLKDFHRVLAVQATAEQRAAFAKIAQYIQDASDQMKTLRESLAKSPAALPLADRTSRLNQAIDEARSGNQKLLASFSSAQKSGLKDITRKLEKADAELDRQTKALDQVVHTLKPESEPVASSAASLDKALAGFQSEQLALGAEMSILFPSGGQNLTFNLPKVNNSVTMAGQSLSIPSSAVLSRTSVEKGNNLFRLKLTAELSDLQQNITGILRSQLNRSPRCGERIEILQATLTPLVPASLMVAQLRYERWVCPPGPGRQSPMEVASGDGRIEIKLTPLLEPDGGPDHTGLGLVPEISRVSAEGSLHDLLRSGDLGIALRDQIAASVLSVLRKTPDLTGTFPNSASATIQRAEFQNAGADQLSLVLDGQLQLSDEQIHQLATQLKQPLSAQGTSAP